MRRESAERTIELDFPGYAIGGLSVGESRAKTMDMIATVLELLPKDKPRYVMGVGYPEEIVQYAAMGVDMMDCVLPTRAARHGLLFTSEGRINIKNARYAQDQGPADPKCGAGSVRDTRGLTCGIFLFQQSRWLECSIRCIIWRSTLTLCAVCVML